ncbi:hypothetical protein AABB24_024315, partial [Solanum stoloniferum]
LIKLTSMVVVISGKALLIHYLLVLLVSSFTKLTHVKGFDLGDLIFDFPPIRDPVPNDYDYEPSPGPRVIEPRLQLWPPPPPKQSPPPPPKQSPPPPSTDSFFIPPFVIPPIDIPPLIPLLPGIPSIIGPITSSQLSPPLLKSPPSPSQCKPSQPDKSIKLTPPPPAKQPPPPQAPSPSPARQPTKAPVKAPFPSPARQPTPPPVKPPFPSPARQPTPPPVKPPFPSPARQPTPPPVKPPSPSRPPPPSKKSPPPAPPPPSIANPPIMAPSPSPAPHPPVIITPFPSSPVAKPPLIPRRPVKPILPPSLPAVKTLTVNGVVYCKPCNSYGVPNLLNATPLQGASARLVCYNGKNAIVQSAITDKNGEFRITPKSLIGADIGNCKIYLVKSLNPTCNVPTNFNGGKTGALLQHVGPPKPPIVTPAVLVPVQPPMSDLYGVGPFIFEASSKIPCAMHRKL